MRLSLLALGVLAGVVTGCATPKYNYQTTTQSITKPPLMSYQPLIWEIQFSPKVWQPSKPPYILARRLKWRVLQSGRDTILSKAKTADTFIIALQIQILALDA